MICFEIDEVQTDLILLVCFIFLLYFQPPVTINYEIGK